MGNVGLRVVASVAAVSALLGAGAAYVVAQSGSAPTAVREALAQTSKPSGAKNRTLALSKVVIPPGAELALHHHLGTQVAHIQSGVLSYTVRDGEVRVMKGASDDDPVQVRRIKAGQTGQIKAGQWIVEQQSDIHKAANRGKQKIVIYLATLLKKGAPASTPVSD